MVDERILALCGRGKNFNAQARIANALSIGDVYYVDLADGADGSSGEDWDHAMLTINGALDMCTAGKNDYIVVRGPHDTAVAVAGILDTIDVDGVHVIGFSGAMNPYTPGYAQRRRSSAYAGPTVQISAHDVEYAGWEVQGQMTGSWSTTTPLAPLQVGTTTVGNERVYIHNVSVRDPGYSSMEGGIALVHCHYPVLEQVSIRSIGNLDIGLALIPGVGPCIQGIIKDCIIGGGYLGEMLKGIEVYDDTHNIGGFTIDNIRFPRTATCCIDLNTASAAYATIQRFVTTLDIADVFDGSVATTTRDNVADNFFVIADGNCGNGAFA